jgi:ABC-type nitrate/sulfonate/bicarbonate transport system substrate-binding protein
VSTTETIFRSHLIARRSVASFADLKGKRIGTASAGSVPYYGVIWFAKRMGWELGRDITIVPGAENFESLKAGKVDAITGSALISAMAPEAGYKDLGNFAQFDIPVAGSGVMFAPKWLASHRDIALRFLESTLEATALMQKDQNVFDAAMAKWFNVKDPQVQSRMYPQVHAFPRKPYPLVEGIKGAVALFSPRGKEAEDFYDASLMAKLDKNGFIDELYR